MILDVIYVIPIHNASNIKYQAGYPEAINANNMAALLAMAQFSRPYFNNCSLCAYQNV